MAESFLKRHGLSRVLNALGTSTITGANVAPREVIEAVTEILRVNVEIDELQRAASAAIARATGAEAGCVTSSASSGIAIACAAAMTGPDLARIVTLPDTAGLRNEVIMQYGHDINFGGRISQMARLSGARMVTIGTGNHCDTFHLRGAFSAQTAAVLFVVNSAIHPGGDFIPLWQAVEEARRHSVSVIVDAAAEPDVRPFLEAGAALVITSGQKAMGAPTSGLICGRKDLVRACYLQNWGIGRAMKVGKEGIAGLIAAVERWYSLEPLDYSAKIAAVAKSVPVRQISPHRVAIDISQIPKCRDQSARRVANLLREGDPPVWVNGAHGSTVVLDLRAPSVEDAEAIGKQVLAMAVSGDQPNEDVPYHDLYWSAARLAAWPDPVGHDVPPRSARSRSRR